MTGEDGFLGRWSRRKRAAEQAVPPVDAAEAGPAPEPAEPVPMAPEIVEAEAEFDPASLPAIDTLTAASDIRAFLAKGVPEALRNAALRKVWASDPFLSTYTGPVDYAWDFNDPNAMPGFSPHAPGGDLTAEVRRIFGEVEAPAKFEEASHPPSGGIMASAETEAPQESGAEPPATALEVTAGPEQAASVAVDEKAERSEDLKPARRHGGAVPL